MFPSNFTLAGSEFHRVGVIMEKARITAFVFTTRNVKSITTGCS